MPYIKLVEPGFEGYNGKLSRVQFKDGVSVEPLSQRDAERLGNILRITELETGKPVSYTQYMAENSGSSAAQLEIQFPTFVPIEREEDKPKRKDKVGAPKQIRDFTPHAEMPPMDYTQESLEKIADEGGIQGIREFAKGYGLNGRSIGELIKTLIKMKERAIAAAPEASTETPA